MSRLSDFYHEFKKNARNNANSGPFGILNWWDVYQSVFDTSHGGERYALSKVPLFGDFIKFRDDVQRWEDAYQRTGKDPQYASRLGGGSLGSSVGLNPTSSLKKMARSLSSVYDAEVEENVVNPYVQAEDGSWHRREI